MATARVLQLLPELLDVNGDGQNALVLARRAGWAGFPAEVTTDPGVRPAVIVAGSGVDADLPRVRELLAPLEERLREWVDDGVPLLAVGTGFEVLSTEIGLGPDTASIAGAGIFPGRAHPLGSRVAGDLVVDTEAGRLVGFENHERGWSGDAGALGSVVHGTGNGAGAEGAHSGAAWGTHLHGPVLAKNPELADILLRAAFGAGYRADDERTLRVDAIARQAREAVLRKLQLAPGAPG